jgi:hypothetical protein
MSGTLSRGITGPVCAESPVDPSGNSSKALNTDILNTENKVLSKENNESIIPKKGTFRRFTTSAKNVSLFQHIDASKYYLNPNVSIQNTTYNEIYLHNPYWITSSKFHYNGGKDSKIKEKDELNRMKLYGQSNNNLGLGFTFRKGDKQFEYDFKIKIDKVIAHYVCSDGSFGTDVIKLSQTEEGLNISDNLPNKIKYKNDFLILPTNDTMFVKIIKVDTNGIFINKVNDKDTISVLSFPRNYLKNKAFFKDGSPVWILNN